MSREVVVSDGADLVVEAAEDVLELGVLVQSLLDLLLLELQDLVELSGDVEGVVLFVGLVFLVGTQVFFLGQFFGLSLLVLPFFLFLLRRVGLSSLVHFEAQAFLLGAFNLNLLDCFCPLLLKLVLLFCDILIILHEVCEGSLSFGASGVLFLDLVWPVRLRRRHSEARFPGIRKLVTGILMHRLIAWNMRIVGL